jgi:hypothetical protein
VKVRDIAVDKLHHRVFGASFLIRLFCPNHEKMRSTVFQGVLSREARAARRSRS